MAKRERLVYFEAGAEDYVTRTFTPGELQARIRSVLRRRQTIAEPRVSRYIRAGSLEPDRHRFAVRSRGRRVDLTRTEFEVLALLMSASGRVFTRDELLRTVWGAHIILTLHAVDVHVARLRGKFTRASLPLPLVETVRGVGYRFRESGLGGKT